MTDLSMVTILSLTCSVTGAVLMAVLAISLRIQGSDTNKQVWNRRMLEAGSCSYFAGLFLPFVLLKVADATGLAVVVVLLGLLVTGLVVLGPLRLVLAAICLVSAGLIIGLTPHLAGVLWCGLALFLAIGMIVIPVAKLVDRYVERQKHRQAASPRR